MTDTIELLEIIGCDASLRYARADELKGVLERAQASAELTKAVAEGDMAPLRQACWPGWLIQVEQTHAIGFPDA